jgi:hypothetical protein
MHADTPSDILRDMARLDPADAGALIDLIAALERTAVTGVARAARRRYDERRRTRRAFDEQAAAAAHHERLAFALYCDAMRDNAPDVGVCACEWLRVQRRCAVLRRKLRESKRHAD